MKPGHLTLKIIALLVMNDLLDSVAQVFMKTGLLKTGIHSIDLTTIAEFTVRSAASPYLWAGLAIYVISFFLWIVVLSRIELSIALPVSSVCYLLTPLFAVVFLHEQVSPVRWLGISLIIAGIYFVSESKRKSMEAS
jgi:drug/metabolite transporter (DMT)-like permease